MIIGIKTLNKNINGKISPLNGPSNGKKRISITSKILLKDNWDQDFEQKYKWEDFASKWAIKRKEKNFYNKQHYKYEDITPARREFLEKQDENMTQKRQEADLSYWAQAAAQAAAAFLQEKDSGSSKLETAPWLKKPAPAPSNEDP